MPVSHRHVEVFRAVMQSGSVTAAAVALHTSQPTVSRELAHMVQRLGFELFERRQGRLVPTARAHALFDEVQRAYQGLERINATAERLRLLHEGSLNIVCLPALAQALVPAACQRFLAQHPGVRVSVTAQDSPWLEEALSAQRHDVGLTERSSAPPGTRITPLWQADEVCVLPPGHPLAEKASLAPCDFEGQAFVSLAPQDPYRQLLDAVFADHGVARQLRIDTDSAASVCAMVAQGLGVAVVNPLTALAFAQQGVLLRRFSVSVPFQVAVVEPLNRPATPLVAAFLAALHTEAAARAERLRAVLAAAQP